MTGPGVPTIAVADATGRLKGAASHLVNQRRQRQTGVEFSWQAEYGVFTFDAKRLPPLIAYVEHQKEHHARSTTISAVERFEQPGDDLSPGHAIREISSSYELDELGA